MGWSLVVGVTIGRWREGGSVGMLVGVTRSRGMGEVAVLLNKGLLDARLDTRDAGELTKYLQRRKFITG